MNKSALSSVFISTLLLLPLHALSKDKDGHELVYDVHREGTQVEFEDEQDEVYEAVQKGLIKPFSELYKEVEQHLKGRVIKVELEEDDDEWIYELKLLHDNNVIKVEYNAATLEMTELKGRHLMNVIRK
ncbi:PepSY domain-containing protein [Vibrio hannami]|uniref:PepSY domain-containing protein n=1 Tax=Vibrio hannami TaxID=2717094 RepID=UPI003EBCB37D